jgi:hypothetical protein
VNGKQKMRAIKDPALMAQLSSRRQIEKCLPQLEVRIMNCKSFIENDRLYDVKRNLAELPERYRKFLCPQLFLPGDVDLEEWKTAEYEQNPAPIIKPSQTSGGRLVRSKSEAFIGSEIEAVPLSYRYEQKLVLFGEVVYPDFMFILPNSGQVVIWEHFGWMDDPEYAKKAMHKIELYCKAGWQLGVNFFFTFETADMPFSFPGAKAKLAEILETDKFIW